MPRSKPDRQGGDVLSVLAAARPEDLAGVLAYLDDGERERALDLLTKRKPTWPRAIAQAGERAEALSRPQASPRSAWLEKRISFAAHFVASGQTRSPALYAMTPLALQTLHALSRESAEATGRVHS